MLMCMIELTGSCFLALYHFQYFDNEEKGHFTFGIIYLALITFGTMASAYGPVAFFQNNDAVYLLIILLVVFGVVLVLARSETYHQEHIQKIFKHISNQQFLKLVLNTHSSGLLILNEECQISFSNSVFDDLFSDQISWAKLHQADTGSNSLSESRNSIS